MEIVEVYKRSEIDEQGNPYPILYMKLDNKENFSLKEIILKNKIKIE